MRQALLAAALTACWAVPKDLSMSMSADNVAPGMGSDLLSGKADTDLVQSTVPTKPLVDAKGLVFDLGFHNGADAKFYLSQGYRVVAIEADPTKVEAGKVMFAAELAAGDLKIENVGITTAGASLDLSFYKSKVNTQWNSFSPAVACRVPTDSNSFSAPADWADKLGPFSTCPIDKTNCSAFCEKVHVHTSTCASLLEAYGQADYMKIDIEGMEAGCLKTLRADRAPTFISVEDTGGACLDQLAALGYTKFKVVNQKGSSSGVWGEDTVDFEYGKHWRDLASVKTWEAKYQRWIRPSFRHSRSVAGADESTKHSEHNEHTNSTGPLNVLSTMHDSMWFDIHATKE